MKRSVVARIGLAASVLGLLAGCSPSTPASPSGSAVPTASQVAATPNATTFTSTTFVIPFSVRVPSWLPARPTDDQPTFVSWDAADGVRKVRVMAPVAVYRPGETTASALPADFTKYFLGLRGRGVKFTDQTTTTISGKRATLVTATTTRSTDGVFGCPSADLSAADCFGFQPDLVLRMAVIDVDGHPLLAWLREDASPEPVPDPVAPFAELLAGLRLR
jgi:hypothetical protein